MWSTVPVHIRTDNGMQKGAAIVYTYVMKIKNSAFRIRVGIDLRDELKKTHRQNDLPNPLPTAQAPREFMPGYAEKSIGSLQHNLTRNKREQGS